MANALKPSFGKISSVLERARSWRMKANYSLAIYATKLSTSSTSKKTMMPKWSS
jgi:hypothetical protein